MGKKSKAEKKAKGGKKKHHDVAVDAQDLASVLVQAARSMRTVLSRNLLESGLYAGQDGVMLALAETDGLTAGVLAMKLGVKAPTMTRTIGRMEAQGFLERRADDEDARLTKVYLTTSAAIGCRRSLPRARPRKKSPRKRSHAKSRSRR